MKTKYDVYEVPNPGKKDKKQYCARLVSSGIVNTPHLAEKIEAATSLTSVDVRSVLSALRYELENSLAEGKRVHLEGLGYFQMKITSDLVEDPDKMRAEYVHFKSISFRPENNLKKKLKGAKFVRTARKRRSASHTQESIEEKLQEYFREHDFITRAEFQQLFSYTKTMALTRLNAFIKEGKIKKAGIYRFPVYTLVK